MEDKKNEKKKSFEDIIAELNSILEKMPDIVEKIKENDSIDRDKKDDEKFLDENKEIIKENDGILNGDEHKETRIENVEKEASSSLDIPEISDLNIEEIKVDDRKEDEDKENKLPFSSDIFQSDKVSDNENKESISVEVSQDEITGVEKQDETELKSIDNVVNEELRIEEGIEQNLDIKIEIPQETDKKTDENIEISDINIEEVEIKTQLKTPQTGDKEVIVDKDGSKISDTLDNLNIEIVEDDTDKKKEVEVIFENFEIKNKVFEESYIKDVNIKLSIELNRLISKTPPENVKEDKIKNVGFIYSGDEEIFIKFLTTVDDICLRSKDTPMFINRSFVMEYDIDFSIDELVLRTKEEKVISVVAIGNIPMEKGYEIETALSQNNIFFIDFNRNNFSKSRIIDFVMELIIR